MTTAAPPETVLRRYRLGPRIDAGDRPGERHQGVDAATGRAVAITVLPGVELGPDRRRRLPFPERFAHPAVLPVLAAGDTEAGLVVVSAQAPGRTLKRLLVGRRLPARTAVTWLTPAAEVIAVVHRAGLVHGSLTADALRIERSGRLSIADVGLAAVAWPKLSPRPPLPLAPEQLAGVSPSRAGDVYALAAILLATIAGAPPTAPGPWPGVPAALAALIAEALSVDPDDRPPGTDALLAHAATALGRPRAGAGAKAAPHREAARTRRPAPSSGSDGAARDTAPAAPERAERPPAAGPAEASAAAAAASPEPATPSPAAAAAPPEPETSSPAAAAPREPEMSSPAAEAPDVGAAGTPSATATRPSKPAVASNAGPAPAPAAAPPAPAMAPDAAPATAPVHAARAESTGERPARTAAPEPAPRHRPPAARRRRLAHPLLVVLALCAVAAVAGSQLGRLLAPSHPHRSGAPAAGAAARAAADPVPAYAAALRRAIFPFDRATATGARALSQATTPRAQAAAATRLASASGAARATLAAARPTPAARPAQATIAAALERSRAGFAALADAVRGGRPATVAAALRRARAGQRAVAAALGRLRRLGYRVG